MKKLLKKKIKIFEKEVSVLMIALVSIGIASAALLPYIGSTLFGSVTIEAPLECWFEDSEGENLGTDIGSIDLSEGQIKIYTRCIGHGEVDDAYGIMIKVTGPEGVDWEGNEFQSISLNESHGENPIENKGDILSALFHVESETAITQFITLGKDSGVNTINLFATRYEGEETPGNPETFADDYTADTNIWNEITIVPEVNIHPGTYNIQMCYVYDLDNPNCEELAP